MIEEGRVELKKREDVKGEEELVSLSTVPFYAVTYLLSNPLSRGKC